MDFGDDVIATVDDAQRVDCNERFMRTILQSQVVEFTRNYQPSDGSYPRALAAHIASILAVKEVQFHAESEPDRNKIY
jgi:hypothetical protein